MPRLSLSAIIFALLAGFGNCLSPDTPSRRAFLAKSVATAAATGASLVSGPALAAAPEIYTTPRGIKYAILKKASQKSTPRAGDIVAIEYTGYLVNGQIFDSSHAEGRSNALMFQLGGTAVIEGLNELVEQMSVGEKVQAIIPSELAFGDKGLCVESTGECLIQPKSTLVYDVTLKRSAIPPP